MIGKSFTGTPFTRTLASAFLGLVLVAGSAAPALAAPCKDAKGKFIKCPPKPAKPAPKKGPCRDAKGKFIKCK
ncbi:MULTISPECIES: hypothetical protein [Sphingobium]|uniref:Uncharacterized protein n=1 Tax=Sphingobium chungbukense TaxID=56193 RepID=A0A0M3AMH8_9SPHN|nr:MULTISPECIES: hypothetical protein [Sphingobium]KKW91050.1 hypothetical protein YP76_15735 [Sphingobium chungbukense]PJG49036.1 hypothetical protein CAF53_12960 [Sphingobium sp. LB126]